MIFYFIFIFSFSKTTHQLVGPAGKHQRDKVTVGEEPKDDKYQRGQNGYNVVVSAAPLAFSQTHKYCRQSVVFKVERG